MNESETLLQSKEETVKTRAPRLAAHKALPQSGADTLVKIIKGYAIASNGGQTKINYKDVASVAGLSPTLISANNKFLLDSQILTSPTYGYYIPTEDAVRFAREAAWDEGGAKAHLRKPIESSWYGQVAMQNFALRAKLTRAELKKSLAIKCGATEGDSAGLEFLIDFIVYTDLVIKDDKGLLQRGQSDDESRTPGAVIQGPGDAWESVRQTPELRTSNAPAPKSDGNDFAQISIHLHIHDFDELTPANAARLREWLNAVSAGDKTELHVDMPSRGATAVVREEPAVSEEHA